MLSSRERRAKQREHKTARERPRMPAALFFRIFVIGSISIVAAGYAIWRHYFVPRPSMLAPIPSATEMPAPEIVPLPSPSPSPSP